MRRRGRRDIEIFSMSFLDVVSCGFGAIILLLVIVKVVEPIVIEQISIDLTGLVQALEKQIFDIRGETTVINRELTSKQEQLSEIKDRLARLKGELTRIKGEHDATRLDMDANTVIESQLARAQQSLSDEQRRLQGLTFRRPASNATIGGVPVDSEYIIFIIDTSGSMQKFAWKSVLEKVEEILEIYPQVKGIQVMNDMGDYMFSSYAGKWIPDSKGRRRAIIKRLATWTPFSNSSPVEGVEAAIKRFYSSNKRISLYIFGDDFSRGSIQSVLNTVTNLNKTAGSGKGRVRIHAVGYPTLLEHGSNVAGAARFSALMRKLAEENDGSFVALNSSR
ncbi:MAG: VWA domain-containing protein [Gammaproteobacteria bacterium]